MKLRRFRRLISGLLLLWLGLLQFPLPLSVRATETALEGKDQSAPYPCMNRPCGCKSAEQCWTSCCCTTKAERIAFVLEHGLEMPAALRGAEAVPATPKSCCAGKTAVACDREATCGPADHCENCKRQPARRRTSVVMLDSVLKCKGLSFQLSQFGSVIVPCVVPQVTLAVVDLGRILLRDDAFSSVALAPPAPPPKIGGLI